VLERNAFAPFRKERRMKLAEATGLHRKSGGAQWRDLRLKLFVRLNQEEHRLMPFGLRPNLDKYA
jgi:hypothetical protein